MTFRAKLLTIVGATALAFILLIVVSGVISGRVSRQLKDLEGRMVPKVALGPRLETQFERVRRTLQDAVAAQDADTLAASKTLEGNLLDTLASAEGQLGPGEAAAARAAVEDYYQAAHDVSRRLIASETGESIVDAMAAMQAKQTRAIATIKQATRLDDKELAAAFTEVRLAGDTSAELRVAIGLACLILVLALSIALSRSVLRNIHEVSVGLARFGRGDFSQPMPATRADELGDLARQANQMAASLGRLARQRDRDDWIKAGQAKMSNQLRGELELDEVARRAIDCLAPYVDAPAAALYFAGDGKELRLLATHAAAADTGGAAPAFRPGEGLVGQAALGKELTVIESPPEGYLRVRSGLGEGAPRAIALQPLAHAGKVTGIVELAMFKSVSEEVRELLASIGEAVSIALEVARSRAATRTLLGETQRQAARLSAQEEELSANNEELEAQQHELKQANEELEVQRRNLETHNVELGEARQREQEKADALATVSEYKSQFLANMSHELRTPLNSMLLLSNLLAANEGANLTEKQVEYCQTIHSAGKELLGLINQVLDLAKIEAGKQEVFEEPVPLDELADRARRVFGPLASNKGLTLSVDVAENLPPEITTDRQRIDQILTNLVGNAIKFTERGSVNVHFRRPAPEVRFERDDLDPRNTVAISVVDTGIGIPPDEQLRVFAPFQQLDGRIDRRYGGTGLGLTIARELAVLLGGELQLVSAAGKGSAFTFYLPERRASSTAPRALPAGALDHPPPARAPGRLAEDDRAVVRPGDAHLLLIEDDPVFAEQLAEVIHTRGFKVMIAPHGQEGLRLAKEMQPKGIVLDVMLPDIDGWTVMERLRFDPATSAIPVHFVSSLDAPERGLAMGAVGYLTKPALTADLIDVVETLAPQAADRSRPILIVEDDGPRGESLVSLIGSEGMRARHVTSAAAALVALAEERFSCLVLDLGLPDADGLRFLELLKERQDIETPPVVVYTGRALTKAETRRIEAYAEAVVLKEGRSTERLMEEIRMFIQHLKEGMPRRARSPLAAARANPTDIRLGGRKILVVDDDMRTVYALSALLRSKGVDLAVADTGVAALEVLESRPDIEAVLMDVMLPEMDGYEAMRRIRADPRFAALPVIALTAKAMKGEREKCLQAGASDYLTKPIEADRLMLMLTAALEAADGAGKRNGSGDSDGGGA